MKTSGVSETDGFEADELEIPVLGLPLGELDRPAAVEGTEGFSLKGPDAAWLVDWSIEDDTSLVCCAGEAV